MIPAVDIPFPPGLLMASRKRSASKNPANLAGWLVAILILALIAGAIFFFWEQKRLHEQARQAAAATPASTPTTNNTQPTAATAPKSPIDAFLTHDRKIIGGLPKPKNPNLPATQYTVLENRAYIVGYSERRKDPLFSAYHLIAQKDPNHLPRPKDFSPDDRTLAKIQSKDYTGSGYDRGHMTPNNAIARTWGSEAQLETFLMSNICPQAPNLNQKVWEKLEQEEINYADRYGELWVIDGPIFADLNGGTTNTLRSGVAVPSAFYKIVIEPQKNVPGKPRCFCVIMPQAVKGTELPGQFVRAMADIEKETGLEFLPELPEAVKTELKSKAFPMW